MIYWTTGWKVPWRSALQYLFMGGVGTRSRLHVDPGGLDLIIAPLVGWKEVTLVHRDDAELVGAMCSDSAQEVERGKRTPLDELLANETPPCSKRNRSCR